MRIETRFGAAALALALALPLAFGSATAASAADALTNAALFDANAPGDNASGAAPGAINFGAWTTVLNQQNVPGNFAAQLFLSKVANPTASDFLTPSAALSAGLTAGANTFYFFADGDDQRGGSIGFGLNLFLDGAGAASPSISAFVDVGAGQTATADSTTGCTSSYTLACVPGAGTLSFTSGGTTYTLTSFQVSARGGPGGTSTVDLVNGQTSDGFVGPAHADGVTDTYGSFTLDVVGPSGSTGGVPEPASWALMITGFGLAGAALRRGRTVAA